MNIDVQHSLKITTSECMNCQTCVNSCPKEGALNHQMGNKLMKPLTIIVLVMVVFFGSIFAAQALGLYQLTPAPLQVGESLNYDEVKGYMSIKEAAEATKTDLKVFYEKFKIPENVPETTKMKGISEVAEGYDLDQAKEALAERSGEAKPVSSEPQNTVNLDGIKGSMTITDAAKTVKLDIKEFYKLFKLPDNVPSNTYMKDLGNVVSGYDYHAMLTSLK